MKNFIEWFSCHSVSKSLLSARPFSLIYDESPEGEFSNHGILDVVRGAATSSQTNRCDNQVNISSAIDQPSLPETSPLAQYNSSKGSKDPLTQVEASKINFLRLVQRIGQSLSNPVVPQVLYRLELASLIRAGESSIKKPTLKIDKAKAIASALEESGQGDLNFSLKILVLGKTGVGKSATINSLFGQERVDTDAFRPSTERIQQVVGTIKGIKITVIDTPGLLPSSKKQGKNRKILTEVRKFIRKSPPDVILYFERLDVYKRGSYYDLQLLNLINNVFGSSIWFNTIIVLTHSSSPLPEEMNGFAVGHEAFVSHCTHLLQSCIHRSVSDTRLENPVVFVENHPMFTQSSNGEKVWLSQLLLLILATKILGNANSLLKFQDSVRVLRSGIIRQPSLPHLVSSLLQPSTNTDAAADEVSDIEEDEEYDQLPPIRILTKAQYQQLSRLQKNAYLDELDYRETLYLKKQRKEDAKRHNSESENTEHSDSREIVQLPDMAIPLSFDSECPSYRYRCVLGTNELLLRPVLDSQGWDHDLCFDGISLDFSKEINRNLTTSVAGQMRKDKEDFSLQSESRVDLQHEKSRLLSIFNIQTAGDDLACSFRGDARFKNLSWNSSGCGFSLTSLGKMYSVGAKLEDSISIGKRFKVIANIGRIVGNSQAAYGGMLEASIMGKDYPVRNEKVTLATTFISFGKDAVLGASLQADFRIGRTASASLNANMNSRRLGQISFKTSTSEHVDLWLVTTAVSLIRAMFNRRINNHELEKF